MPVRPSENPQRLLRRTFSPSNRSTASGTSTLRAAAGLFCLLAVTALCAATASAQSNALGSGPWDYTTRQPAVDIRVRLLARGIVHPWGLAFLPDGDFLVSERAGALKLIRAGSPDPIPVPGAPAVAEASSGGLMDIALHPQFETNQLIYFVYAKPGPIPAGASYNATTALGRGRFDGAALTDVEDVFVADAWSTAPGGHGARILFAPDGTLFMTQPHRREPDRAQDTTDHVGALLRINDDGSVPADNPFVGVDGFLPEIYSYGHRVGEGLAFHPDTGALWATEHGPLGGDELNVIEAGGNYGWPLVTYGRDYDGSVRSPLAGGSDRAGGVLGAVNRNVRPDVLHRRCIPGLARPCLRRLADDRACRRHRPRAAARV